MPRRHVGRTETAPAYIESLVAPRAWWQHEHRFDDLDDHGPALCDPHRRPTFAQLRRGRQIRRHPWRAHTREFNPSLLDTSSPHCQSGSESVGSDRRGKARVVTVEREFLLATCDPLLELPEPARSRASKRPLELPPEDGLDIRLYDNVPDVHRRRASLAVFQATTVIHALLGTRVHEHRGRPQRPLTPGAAQDPAQQTAARGTSRPRRQVVNLVLLGPLPSRLIDQRLMCCRVEEIAVAHLAAIQTRGQHGPDYGRLPVSLPVDVAIPVPWM